MMLALSTAFASPTTPEMTAAAAGPVSLLVVVVVMMCLRLHHSRVLSSSFAQKCSFFAPAAPPCMSDRSNAARRRPRMQETQASLLRLARAEANVLLQSRQFADVQLSVFLCLAWLTTDVRCWPLAPTWPRPISPASSRFKGS